jgi:hypothetical protein
LARGANSGLRTACSGDWLNIERMASGVSRGPRSSGCSTNAPAERQPGWLSRARVIATINASSGFCGRPLPRRRAVFPRPVSGPNHSGTGKHRKYDASSVYDAAILNAVARAGLHVVTQTLPARGVVRGPPRTTEMGAEQNQGIAFSRNFTSENLRPPSWHGWRARLGPDPRRPGGIGAVAAPPAESRAADGMGRGR